MGRNGGIEEKFSLFKQSIAETKKFVILNNAWDFLVKEPANVICQAHAILRDMGNVEIEW